MKLKTPQKARTLPLNIKSHLNSNINQSYLANHVSYDAQIDALFLDDVIERTSNFNNQIRRYERMGKAGFEHKHNPYKNINIDSNPELFDKITQCSFDEYTRNFVFTYMTEELKKREKALAVQSEKKATKNKISKLLKLKNPLKKIANKTRDFITSTKTIVGSILWWAVLMSALAATPGDQDNQQVWADETSHNTIKTSLTLQEKSVNSSTIPEVDTQVNIPKREPVPVLVNPVESSEHADETQEITPKNKYQMLLDDIQPWEWLWKSAERAKKLFWMKKDNKIDLQKLLKFALTEKNVTEKTMTKEFQAKTLIKYLILNKHIKY